MRRSLHDHIELCNGVETLRVSLQVPHEVWQLDLLLVDQVLFAQSQAVLHCDLSAVQVHQVQSLPVLQDLERSHQVYLVFVHP